MNFFKNNILFFSLLFIPGLVFTALLVVSYILSSKRGDLLGDIDRTHNDISSFKSDDSLKDNKDLDKIIDGIEIVKKDLVSIFKKNGIEPISCINKKFDPNFHQAMLEVDDNTKDPGTVVQEMQTGYMMKSRLLRPSLVSVAKKRNENKDKKWLF